MTVRTSALRMTAAAVMAILVAVDLGYGLWHASVYPVGAPATGVLCVLVVLSMGVLPILGSWLTLLAASGIAFMPAAVDYINVMLTMAGLPAMTVPWIPGTTVVAAAMALLLLGMSGRSHVLGAGLLLIVDCGAMCSQGAVGRGISMATCGALMLTIGCALRLERQRMTADAAREQANRELDSWRTRREVASGLHESVTNRLSLVLADLELIGKTADDAMSDDRSRLVDDMYSAARQALKETHRAIAVLEGQTESWTDKDDIAKGEECRTGDMGATDVESETDVSWDAPIVGCAQGYDARLANLGFIGSTTVRLDKVEASHDMVSLCLAVMQELYVNLIRYADPAQGYDMSVISNDRTIIVRQTNGIATNDYGTESQGRNGHVEGGGGLYRLYRRLHEIGGELSTQRTPIDVSHPVGEWVVCAVIPRRP